MLLTSEAQREKLASSCQAVGSKKTPASTPKDQPRCSSASYPYGINGSAVTQQCMDSMYI